MTGVQTCALPIYKGVNEVFISICRDRQPCRVAIVIKILEESVRTSASFPSRSPDVTGLGILGFFALSPSCLLFAVAFPSTEKPVQFYSEGQSRSVGGGAPHRDRPTKEALLINQVGEGKPYPVQADAVYRTAFLFRLLSRRRLGLV